MDVGAKAFEGADRRGFVEDRYVVDHLESSDHFGPFGLIHDWSGFAFERAHTGVAVQADDEDVTQRFCVPKTADMAGVQKVEAAIGPDDNLPAGAPCVAAFSQFVQSSEFGALRQTFSLAQDVDHGCDRGGSRASHGGYDLLADPSF